MMSKKSSAPAEKEDVSQVRRPIQISGKPVEQILNSVHYGSPELRCLLMDECDIIFECKVCRALFRDLPNFISHKRSYCTKSSADMRHLEIANLPEEQVVVVQPQPPPDEKPTVPTMRKPNPPRTVKSKLEETVQRIQSGELGHSMAYKVFTEAAEKLRRQRETMKVATVRTTAIPTNKNAVFIDVNMASVNIHERQDQSQPAQKEEKKALNVIITRKAGERSNSNHSRKSDNVTRKGTAKHSSELQKMLLQQLNSISQEKQKAQVEKEASRPGINSQNPSANKTAKTIEDMKKVRGADVSSQADTSSVRSASSDGKQRNKFKGSAELSNNDKNGNEDEKISRRKNRKAVPIVNAEEPGTKDSSNELQDLARKNFMTMLAQVEEQHLVRRHPQEINAKQKIVSPKQKAEPVSVVKRKTSFTAKAIALAKGRRAKEKHKDVTCEECKSTFSDTKSLIFHNKVHHPEEKTFYPCPLCPNVFYYLFGVTRHLLRNHDKCAAEVDEMRDEIRKNSYKKVVPLALPSEEPTRRVQGMRKSSRRIVQQTVFRPMRVRARDVEMVDADTKGKDKMSSPIVKVENPDRSDSKPVIKNEKNGNDNKSDESNKVQKTPVLCPSKSNVNSTTTPDDKGSIERGSGGTPRTLRTVASPAKSNERRLRQSPYICRRCKNGFDRKIRYEKHINICKGFAGRAIQSPPGSPVIRSPRLLATRSRQSSFSSQRGTVRGVSTSLSPERRLNKSLPNSGEKSVVKSATTEGITSGLRSSRSEKSVSVERVGRKKRVSESSSVSNRSVCEDPFGDQKDERKSRSAQKFVPRTRVKREGSESRSSSTTRTERRSVSGSERGRDSSGESSRASRDRGKGSESLRGSPKASVERGKARDSSSESVQSSSRERSPRAQRAVQSKYAKPHNVQTTEIKPKENQTAMAVSESGNEVAKTLPPQKENISAASVDEQDVKTDVISKSPEQSPILFQARAQLSDAVKKAMKPTSEEKTETTSDVPKQTQPNTVATWAKVAASKTEDTAASIKDKAKEVKKEDDLSKSRTVNGECEDNEGKHDGNSSEDAVKNVVPALADRPKRKRKVPSRNLDAEDMLAKIHDRERREEPAAKRARLSPSSGEQREGTSIKTGRKSRQMIEERKLSGSPGPSMLSLTIDEDLSEDMDEGTSGKNRSQRIYVLSGSPTSTRGSKLQCYNQAKVDKLVDEENLKCLECGETCSQIFNLRRHIIRVHLKWSRYKCKLCKYKCFDRSECTTHILRTHKNSSAYQNAKSLNSLITDLAKQGSAARSMKKLKTLQDKQVEESTAGNIYARPNVRKVPRLANRAARGSKPTSSESSPIPASVPSNVESESSQDISKTELMDSSDITNTSSEQNSIEESPVKTELTITVNDNEMDGVNEESTHTTTTRSLIDSPSQKSDVSESPSCGSGSNYTRDTGARAARRSLPFNISTRNSPRVFDIRPYGSDTSDDHVGDGQIEQLDDESNSGKEATTENENTLSQTDSHTSRAQCEDDSTDMSTENNVNSELGNVKVEDIGTDLTAQEETISTENTSKDMEVKTATTVKSDSKKTSEPKIQEPPVKVEKPEEINDEVKIKNLTENPAIVAESAAITSAPQKEKRISKPNPKYSIAITYKDCSQSEKKDSTAVIRPQPDQASSKLVSLARKASVPKTHISQSIASTGLENPKTCSVRLESTICSHHVRDTKSCLTSSHKPTISTTTGNINTSSNSAAQLTLSSSPSTVTTNILSVPQTSQHPPTLTQTKSEPSSKLPEKKEPTVTSQRHPSLTTAPYTQTSTRLVVYSKPARTVEPMVSSRTSSISSAISLTLSSNSTTNTETTATAALTNPDDENEITVQASGKSFIVQQHFI